MPGGSTNRDNILATWIHLDGHDDESIYPQMGARSTSQVFQNTYWRCVVTFFATSERTNGGSVRPVLFTNAKTFPVVDGVDVKEFLDKLGVEVRIVPFTYKPPEGYYPAWRNQFYILDILKDLATIEDAKRYVVLDSDCIIAAPLDGLYDEIDKSEVVLLVGSEDLDWSTNGLTCHQMKDIFEELDGKPMDFTPLYYDGELFAANAKGLSKLVAEIDPIWQASLERFQQGKLKFNEEAHFLGYLYHRTGYAPGDQTKRVRRIWTQAPYVTTVASDADVEVWHLPAEKTKGLRQVFVDIRKPESWFWKNSDLAQWRATIADMVGIGTISSKKRSQDFWNKVRARTETLLAGASVKR